MPKTIRVHWVCAMAGHDWKKHPFHDEVACTRCGKGKTKNDA